MVSIRKYLSVIIATLIVSVNSAQARNIEDVPENTLLGSLAGMDHVLVVDIVKYTRHQSSGGLWADAYGVLHLEGYALTANGRERIRGRYLLRVNADLTDSQVSEIVDPKRIEVMPIINNQIASFIPKRVMVTQGGFIAGANGTPDGVPIYGLDDDGEPIWARQWNECNKDDLDIQDVTVVDDEGNDVFISRKDQLASVTAFSCENGGSYVEGRGEKPADYVEPPLLTLEEFEDALIERMKLDFSTATSPRPGIQPKNGPSDPSLRLDDKQLELDKKQLYVLSHMPPSSVKQLNPRFVAFVAERLTARGVEIPPVLSEVRAKYFREHPRPRNSSTKKGAVK